MYSIKDLERLTGIKAHTIRMWEKRYKIIDPNRTNTNIRTYCDKEVKKLLNIAVLNKHGVRISKLAELPESELREKVVSLDVGLNISSVQLEYLIISMIDLDEIKFEGVLNRSIIKNGFEDTFKDMLLPFFERVSTLWQTGSIKPFQEHFASNLVRQKLFAAIDQIVPNTNENAPSMVFFLHENELHEIGLLFYLYIAKKLGIRTLYLGQNFSFNHLESIHKKLNSRYLFTAFTTSMNDGVIENYINKLASTFCDTQIFISGYRVSELRNLPANVKRVDSTEHLKEEIKLIYV